MKFKKNKLIEDLISENIKPILVGGSVRDYLIDESIIPKDIDIELYTNKSYEEILSVLRDKNYHCDIVGKSFGVIKISLPNGDDFDISLPRTEKSSGNKHTDFEIVPDGTLSYKQAFIRRDFTFNAIGYDYSNNSFIDEYNGLNDLKNRIIKHVDNKTFVEDPLRIYRAIQFAARLDFKIDNETKNLIHNMIKNGLLDSLPKERIFTEFNKLLLKSKKPSIGFELMREFGILDKYFNELSDLVGIEQDEKWHPEGDVWIHTMMVIDKMANLEFNNKNDEKKLLYMYACLCHDFGKKECTQENDGKITSRGHEGAGVKPTISFMNKLTNDKKLIEQIVKLVELHLQPSLLYSANARNSAIKRLSNKLIESNLSLIDLAIVNKADGLGRTTKEALENKSPQYDWLLEKIKFVGVVKEKPLIIGKDLIDRQLIPGPEFKEILNVCYEKQLEENIDDRESLINFLDDYLDTSKLELN